MNRPTGPKSSLFAFSALSVAVLLSGCVSAPSTDVAGQPATETTSPDATPSPTGTAGAGEDAGEASGSEEPSAAPSSPSAPSAAPAPSSPAAPTPSPSPEAKTPTVSVLSQKCTSSRLTVMLAASYDSGYRKGIRSIVVERPNEYNALIDEDANWLGPETGRGDQWTVQPAGSRTQRFKDTLKITAKADDGTTKIIQVDITANC